MVFDQSFNHYVQLKTGAPLQQWLSWLKEEFGDVQSVAERMTENRWGMYGGKVGFKTTDDAKHFIEAAKDDCQQEYSLW